MKAAQFAAALNHAAHDIEDALEATVRIHYVGAYRRFLGLAPIDTGAHRAGFAPFSGDTPSATFIRERDGAYPNPGDGLARTVASGFRWGDRIGFAAQERTRAGFPYGVMIQPPNKRPLFGFAPGSRLAVSNKAPAGDWAVVFEELEADLPRDLEHAVARALEGR